MFDHVRSPVTVPRLSLLDHPRGPGGVSSLRGRFPVPVHNGKTEFCPKILFDTFSFKKKYDCLMTERFLRNEMMLGPAAVERLAACRVCVVGLGGVGSGAVEVLARAGVGELTLIDQDVYGESNVNRQLGALTSTLGQPKAEVLARRVLEKYGLGEYAIHRVGHGQGLGRHEEPFLIFDSDLVLQEGMVFTVEPGIYIPHVGGFRHSDTLILTAGGYENTTDFGRTMEELTFA